MSRLIADLRLKRMEQKKIKTTRTHNAAREERDM